MENILISDKRVTCETDKLNKLNNNKTLNKGLSDIFCSIGGLIKKTNKEEATKLTINQPIKLEKGTPKTAPGMDQLTAEVLAKIGSIIKEIIRTITEESKAQEKSFLGSGVTCLGWLINKAAAVMNDQKTGMGQDMPQDNFQPKISWKVLRPKGQPLY